MKDEFRWPLATIVGIEDKRLLVEFLDAKEKKCSIAVSVSDETMFEMGQTVDLSRGGQAEVDTVERKPVRVDKVSIRPEKLYSLRVNGKKVKGLFQERDSMSGMKKLVRVGNGPYCELVVDCPDALIEVLGTVLGAEEDVDVTVIKASPDLAHEMVKKTESEDENE